MTHRGQSACAPWVIAAEPPGAEAAAALWRAYYTEVSDRWYLLHEGRGTPREELAREIAANDGDGLLPPTGLLLVARYGGAPAGTAGVRLLDAATAELKRVFVRKELRGRGGGAALLAAAEEAARELGAGRLVLDTRHDLTEARALYARYGYRETPPHNTEPYADHWLAKDLRPPAAL
ncbi:N-acetyltransferase [Streptomyces sulfonofaciens]|uniref:N-acetyltransferase n=1 Tax=Streptomyces sulfonofaciens TaxID=68272 RepID=A0A919GG60_9ACTN|nr:GNAT family N-acetyltransferase [Streptomyces sulfonofaciens]GHH84427.1 N-acetyltransferase [Streptomyces sulfonofaciens]